MKKMRKANVITALVLTVVMIAAMTGIAAAENMGISAPSPSEVTPGGPAISYTITMDDFIDTSNAHTIYATVVSGTATDLQFQFEWGASSSGWLDSGSTHVWTWGPPSSDPDTLTLNVKAVATPTDSVGTTYIFKVYDSDGAYDDAHATTKSTSIPEFATIAIPVASILGLLFFFNHRKHKEE